MAAPRSTYGAMFAITSKPIEGKAGTSRFGDELLTLVPGLFPALPAGFSYRVSGTQGTENQTAVGAFDIPG